MEPAAHIDLKTVDSRFVFDDLYEHIDAPMFIDLSSSSSRDSNVHDSWFCRSNCRHSKNLSEDLIPSPFSPPKVKLAKSRSVSEFPPSKRTIQRGAGLKRKGQDLKHKQNVLLEEDENRNPNFPQRSNQTGNPAGGEIKADENRGIGDEKEECGSWSTPWMKRTLSSRNLFAGGDVVNQITDFCRRELRKLTRRTKGAGDSDKKVKNPIENLNLLQDNLITESASNSKYTMISMNPNADDVENTPPLPLNVKNQRVEDLFFKIRTHPPTPQCISTPPGSKQLNQIFKTPERGILRKKSERMMKEEVEVKKCYGEATSTGKGTSSFGMFLGALKPCTLSD